MTRQYLAEQPSVAYKAQELICCLNDRPALLLLINGTLGGRGACVCGVLNLDYIFVRLIRACSRVLFCEAI